MTILSIAFNWSPNTLVFNMPQKSIWTLLKPLGAVWILKTTEDLLGHILEISSVLRSKERSWSWCEEATSYWRIIGLTDLVEREGEGEKGWSKIQEVLEMEDKECKSFHKVIRWWQMPPLSVLTFFVGIVVLIVWWRRKNMINLKIHLFLAKSIKISKHPHISHKNVIKYKHAGCGWGPIILHFGGRERGLFLEFVMKINLQRWM